MDAGRIVEVGTHEELMARGAMYFEMVERQRRSMGSEGITGDESRQAGQTYGALG